jgi:hypothetical protein
MDRALAASERARTILDVRFRKRIEDVAPLPLKRDLLAVTDLEAGKRWTLPASQGADVLARVR